MLVKLKTMVISVRETNMNRTILLTVSITVLGLTWFAYYFQVVYNKNKRILKKARRLVERVITSFYHVAAFFLLLFEARQEFYGQV